jgi:F-type H+-transporting ATPase subunit delta
MKSAKKTQREARELFGLCLVNGRLDEDRARAVVQRLLGEARSGSLATLSRFHRLVRLDRAKRRADITSAAPLSADVRSDLETAVARLYGPDVVTSFAEDPALLGGVRIAVGSDVYDGTIKAGLDALEARI